MAPTPSLDAQALASQYGWSMAMLNSDPSLRKLFDKAVAETWAPDKFVAELRSTEWYKKNSESMRQASVLRSTDPATWNQRVDQATAQATALARQLGAPMGGSLLRQIGRNIVEFGWNDAQVRDHLSGYVGAVTGKGRFLGQAADNVDQMRSYANDMGIRLGIDWLNEASRNIASGRMSVAGQQQVIREMARSAYPHLARRLEAGETIKSITDPYRQTMASILEMNPEHIDAFTPQLQKAISGKDEKGNPTLKSLWEFEQDLRQDPRWLKTKNAQDSVMSTARKVLNDFGLAV